MIAWLERMEFSGTKEMTASASRRRMSVTPAQGGVYIRTGSGPGSPSGQPACGGGSDWVADTSPTVTSQRRFPQ